MLRWWLPFHWSWQISKLEHGKPLRFREVKEYIPGLFGEGIDKCVRINGMLQMSATSCLFLPVIPIEKGVLASQYASIDHLEPHFKYFFQP